MNLSTTHLVLAPDGAVDLQLHTTYSDGIWTPAQLFDHLVSEQFALLDTPSAQQPYALVVFVKNYGTDTGATSAEQIVLGAGSTLATNDITAVVDAAHRSGAVCLIAHPGRDDGFVCFDIPLLDQLCHEIPIDGLEVYYPAHTAEQVALYREYARQHRLLISAGSDSHGPDKQPIKYRANLCRELLERVDIQLSLGVGLRPG